MFENRGHRRHSSRMVGPLSRADVAVIVALAVLVCLVFWPKSDGSNVAGLPSDPPPRESGEEVRSPHEAPAGEKAVIMAKPESVPSTSESEMILASNRLSEEYRQAVDSFTKDVKAYHQSMPVYGQYMQLLEDKIAPMRIKGAPYLAELRSQGIEFEGYVFRQKDEAAMGAFIGTFREFALEFRNTASSGKMTVDPYRLAQVSFMLLHPSTRDVDFETTCPYPEGTQEYIRYHAKLAQCAERYAYLWSKNLSILPPHLEARREKLEARKEELDTRRAGWMAFAPSLQGETLPEAVDSYSRRIVEIDLEVKEAISEEQEAGG